MLHIEIFSDVICPWCFIGKRRLDQVLATSSGEGVSLRWRPYLLYPNLPSEGLDRMTFLRRRYGEDADPKRAPGRIVEEAAGEGITMRYNLMRTVPNTMLAHRLMEFAFPYGVQHQLAEGLFNAYFCVGRDVGDPAVLVEIAIDAGLPGEMVQAHLSSDAGQEEIQTQLARAPELGISGVPGYYLADSFLLPGAQSSEVMQQIIDRVKARIAERAGQAS